MFGKILQLKNTMPRRGNKTQVVVWVDAETGIQVAGKRATYLNTATHGKVIERRKYHPKLRKHVIMKTRLEKSGSLGLARNK